ncbi:MAG: hypothetical protein IJX28_00750 [Clostridia bacterium]|nr:hypothetical protein [Clostridia bacterium]
MTCRELYEAALRLVCENAENGDVSDYEDRAGYILATAVTQCAPLDALYRKATGGSAVPLPMGVYLDLDADFPLSDIFSAAVLHYLCAMLVLDENEAMSDAFFEKYTDAIALIQSSLPFVGESITDRYQELI